MTFSVPSLLEESCQKSPSEVQNRPYPQIFSSSGGISSVSSSQHYKNAHHHPQNSQNSESPSQNHQNFQNPNQILQVTSQTPENFQNPSSESQSHSQNHSQNFYPQVYSSSESEEKETFMMGSSIAKDKQEIVTVHTHNSLMMGSSIRSSTDQREVVEESKGDYYGQESESECESGVAEGKYPRVMSSEVTESDDQGVYNEYYQTKRGRRGIQEMKDSSEEIGEIQVEKPRITAQIEVKPKVQVLNEDLLSDNEQMDLFKFASKEGSNKEI